MSIKIFSFSVAKQTCQQNSVENSVFIFVLISLCLTDFVLATLRQGEFVFKSIHPDHFDDI